MEIRDLIRVVAAVGLNQHHHMAESQSVDGEAACGVQVTGAAGGAPARFDPLSGVRGDAVPPPLVLGEAQMIQGRTIQTFRSVGATSEQALHQCLSIAGERIPTQLQTLLLKPVQDRQTTGGSVESHPVRQPAITHRIVRQHQRHMALVDGRGPEPHPMAGMIHKPVDAVVIGGHAGNRRGESGIIRAQVTESAGSCAEARIQLGHDHLKGEVQRCQASAARQPLVTASSADQQLQHRQIKVIPEWAAEAGISTANGCERGAADHDLNLFAVQQVLHAALHGRVTKAAHPEKAWTETLTPQFSVQRLGKTQVSALMQRSIKNNTDPRPCLGLPVPGQWVGHRTHTAGIRWK